MPVLSNNTNELKTGAPGRFDRHRPVASPRSGACRRRCRRFGFPVRAGKTPSSNGMPRTRAETWIQARAAPGPERASRLRRGSPALDSGPLGQPLFRRCTALSATHSPLWRKRGTRKSRLETKTENEALSALLARLWCHLILQNPANRTENLTRLCSATIGRTGWRMVQFGAIRSRQKVFWQFWESGSNFWPCAWLGQCSENSEKP